MTIRNIENHPTYKKVLADSYGGVMYGLNTKDTYPNADEVITLWDQMTAAQKDSADGIMKGAIDFLKGND